VFVNLPVIGQWMNSPQQYWTIFSSKLAAWRRAFGWN